MKVYKINQAPDKKQVLLFVIVALIVVGLLSSVTMIDTGKIGVVTTFGKVTGRELDAGVSLRWPIVNSVTVYDVKIQKEETENQAATKDLQNVTAKLVINYALNRGSVSEIHKTIGQDYKDKIIEPISRETFKSIAAKYNASELITKRQDLKDQVQQLLSERLNKYGVGVKDVNITNFQFSDNFAKAIEEKQVAQQNAERAKFNLEAAKTDAEAQKVQAQTLSKEFLQKMAIEKWDGKMPQYVGGGSVFNIPLK